MSDNLEQASGPCTIQTYSTAHGNVGLVVDQETGEIIEIRPVAEDILADKERLAMLTLAVRTRLLAEADAVDGEPDVVYARAVLANAQAMRARLRRKAESYERRTSHIWAEWLQEKLAGAKARYFDTIYGRLRFRKTVGSVRVIAPEAAAAFCQSNKLDHLVTTVPKVSITSELKQRLFALPDHELEGLGFMVERPVADKFSIEWVDGNVSGEDE